MHNSVPIRFSFLFKPTLHLTLALLTLVLLYYTECIDLKFGKVKNILHIMEKPEETLSNQMRLNILTVTSNYFFSIICRKK